MDGSLTEEGRAAAEAVGRRHDLPTDAVATLLAAIHRGGGRQAQFSHPALGGMGQWSRGGGIMIGDMFNHSLKAKVEQVCSELAERVLDERLFASERADGSRDWWPEGLGRPSAVGSQNEQGYACFPDSRRLAIRDGGGIELYDTGEHRISGVSQQQGAGRDLRFTSQHGTVRLSDLARLDGNDPSDARAAHRVRGEPSSPEAHDAPGRGASPGSAARDGGDVLGLIERLHELQRRGILTAEEFAAKKTELLTRL